MNDEVSSASDTKAIASDQSLSETQLLARVGIRLQQNLNASWATVTLCILLLLMIIYFVRSRMWETYQAPREHQYWDEIELLDEQPADSNVFFYHYCTCGGCLMLNNLFQKSNEQNIAGSNNFDVNVPV